MKDDVKKLFKKASESDATNVRVKSPSERYSDKRAVGLNTKTRQPVRTEAGTSDVTLPSERSTAQTGVFIKFLASRCGAGCSLTEHEKGLLEEMVALEPWAGEVDGESVTNYRNATRTKALLDDALSGGAGLTPLVIDQDLISTPLLTGEVYPYCDHVELSRGAQVQANSIGGVVVNSGGADNQQIALFGTNGMIGQLPATVFTVDFAIELGRDFLSDSVAAIGTAVQHEISMAMLQWLDRVVVRGNGAVEPLGVMLSPGVTAVACAGATTINSAENLLFSVPKAQRNLVSSPSTIFCTNELSYQRLRSAPVGVADARRIFGMDHESYRILSRPWRIETGLANTDGFFGDMKRYRVWRRKGLSFETSITGDHLLRRNLMLVVARMRIAARCILPSSFGVTGTLQV